MWPKRRNRFTKDGLAKEEKQENQKEDKNKSKLYIELRDFGFTVKQIKEAEDNDSDNYFNIE